MTKPVWTPRRSFGSTRTFDTDKLQLNVTLPQIYIDVSARGYINPSRWDEGINALMVNYDFSGSSTVHSNEDDNNDFYYLNLRNGANTGAWRLRNYSTLNVTDGESSYHSINTYLQRDIAALRSQIMLGIHGPQATCLTARNCEGCVSTRMMTCCLRA